MPPWLCAACGAPWDSENRFCTRCGGSSYLERAAPPRRGATRWIVLAVVLGLVLGGGTAWALFAVGSSEPTASRSSSSTQLAVAGASFGSGLSLLSEPGKHWTLSADDIMPGATFMATSPDADVTPIPMSAGQILITAVAGPADSGISERFLVGVDTQTGKVLWQESLTGFPACVTVLSELACLLRDGGSGSLEVRDPETGELVQKKTVTRFGGVIGTDGSDIYLAEWFGDAPRATKISLDGLTTIWSQDYESVGSEQTHGAWIDVEAGRLLFTFTAETRLVDARTGRLLATSNSGILDPGGYQIESDYGVGHTTVTDLSGYPILDRDSNAWYGLAPRGHVGIGATLYDLSTGTERWSRPDLTYPYWNWVDRGRTITVAGEDPGFLVLDGATGETLWESDQSDSGTWTADAYLVAEEGTLQVRARDDGRPAWERSLDADPEDWPEVYVTDSAVLAGTTGLLEGFTGFTATAAADASTGDPEQGTDYVTACGSEPEFTAVEAEDRNGGLTLTVEIHAVCPSGQWLNSSNHAVLVHSSDETRTIYASGSFDFSGSPRWVPGSESAPARLDLVFPYDSTYSTAEEVREAIERNVVVVPCETDPDAATGAVPSDQTAGADAAVPAPASGPAADAPDPEESALAALRRIAAADDPWVSDRLDGAWMPQLSSKRPGTEDDALVYTYVDILAEHLRLRARYPAVKLVWSTDWSSFLADGYWVTLVGQPSPTWRPAVRWCPSNGFDTTHCYGKHLLRNGSPEGATKFIRDL